MLLLGIYRLHLQQKSEKRCLECLIKYKQIKSYKSVRDYNEFAKIDDSYNRLCESIHKTFN